MYETIFYKRVYGEDISFRDVQLLFQSMTLPFVPHPMIGIHKDGGTIYPKTVFWSYEQQRFVGWLEPDVSVHEWRMHKRAHKTREDFDPASAPTFEKIVAQCLAEGWQIAQNEPEF